MKINQYLYDSKTNPIEGISQNLNIQLVFLFGSRDVFEKKEVFKNIKEKFPNAFLFGCTTSGEIFQNSVHDSTLTITAIQFEHTTVRQISTNLNLWKNSYEAGNKWEPAAGSGHGILLP
jgi:hypothetical protein